MKCLIVGGTGFLGGAMADAIADAGHETVILSRGQSQRKGVAGVKVLCADRDDDLSILKGQKFDWVFDSCAYTPDMVNNLLDVLGDGIKRYVLISSISAYDTFSRPDITEDIDVPNATEEDFVAARKIARKDRAQAPAYGAAYGRLKWACEITAAERLGDRVTSLRVGLLVGAGDYTDRLTWWVRRIDEAHDERKQVIAPAPKSRSVQVIDVRDVADFALRCVENGLSGVWNVTSQPIEFSYILDRLIEVSASDAEVNWIAEELILDAGVVPWTDLPLMAPAVPEFKYFMEVDTSRALAAGLKCRPLEETLKSVLEWDRRRRDVVLECGLTAEQEAKLLGGGA
ncbi:MAG: epimerase [Hyphomicrobiales bacterium]|nr:MAG: epimerase [Hyphomicrobiales bacterium]